MLFVVVQQSERKQNCQYWKCKNNSEGASQNHDAKIQTVQENLIRDLAIGEEKS